MISFEEHAKRLGLDNEERELLADFEKNHAGKPQITESRRKELRRIAEASTLRTRLRNSKMRLYSIRLPQDAVDIIKQAAKASGGKYQSMVKDSVVELAARLKEATT